MLVGVIVAVFVGVLVAVGVMVGVLVGVFVGVGVGVFGTGVMVRLTVAILLSAVPSLALNVNPSGPL